jgi:Protein of unknown function (DUF1059)
MKTITCREAGFECDYIVRGETEEELSYINSCYSFMDVAFAIFD